LTWLPKPETRAETGVSLWELQTIRQLRLVSRDQGKVRNVRMMSLKGHVAALRIPRGALLQGYTDRLVYMQVQDSYMQLFDVKKEG
jgi:hypothetical protein